MARRYALCVGVNKYKHSSQANLWFARSDAESMSKVLSDEERGNFVCNTLFDSKATKKEIVKEFNKLLMKPDLKPKDLVLFYYAGHGGLDDSQDLYLIPYDARFQQLQNQTVVDVTSCVHIKELEIALGNMKAGTVVLIVDACYSGASGKALGRIKYKDRDNIIFVGASRSTQGSHEIPSLQHGLFTNCFLEGLNTRPTKGEWITLHQLLSFIESKMKEYALQGIEVSTHFVNPNILIARNPIYKVMSQVFTEEIADIFSLTGGQIRRSREYPNFFLVEQTMGLSTSHMGIMVLDNKITAISESQVDQFLILIESYRHRKHIDRGLLVTYLDIDPTLTLRIQKSMIAESRTKGDLLRNLMDFKFYLRRIINQFEVRDPELRRQPPLGKVYVDLKAVREGTSVKKSVLDIVTSWLSSEGEKLAILGEYGSGKTAFCKKLSYEMAKKYIAQEEKRIPIVIDLRKFPRIEADLEALVINHLSRVCNIRNPSWEAFRTMNDAGFLLLIFDGLDEMAVRTSPEIVEQNLVEIEKLANAPMSKVILTSRPEYFWTSGEETELFDRSGFRYARVKLEPFTPKQIQTFLRKRIPLIEKAKNNWTYYYKRIQEIHDLSDLSKRPVFLEMISETLIELIEEGKAINRNSLYRTYLMKEITRQAIEKKRELKLDAPKRLELMKVMALELFRKDLDGLTSSDVLDLIRGHLTSLQLLELEGHVADFLTCSFLKRVRDKFSFSHRTFMEFLVSDGLFGEIAKKAPSDFARSALTGPILDFLGERKIEESTLWDWIVSTKTMPNEIKSESFLGGNSISLLGRRKYVLKSRDLSKTSLNGAKLNQLDLSNTDFREAYLCHATLHGSELRNANLANARLEYIDLRDASLAGANLEGATLERANLRKTEMSKVVLNKANLSRALLANANLLDAKLVKANLTHANLLHTNLKGADLRQADLRFANLSSAKLEGANLSKAILVGAKLVEANLYGANFFGANLTNADVRGADLRASDLRNANLANTRLQNAILSGAKLNDETVIDNIEIDLDDAQKRGFIDEQFALRIWMGNGKTNAKS